VVERYVVDTGVFLRWWVPQVGFEHAREVRQRFVDGRVDLVTTDTARYELAHVLRTKALLPGHLDRAGYLAGASLLDDLGLARSADADDMARSAELAVDRNLRFFDAVFAELALREDTPLLTADARLARALAGVVDVQVLRGVVEGP
jgi:predicted nucleic acid-binding protein